MLSHLAADSTLLPRGLVGASPAAGAQVRPLDSPSLGSCGAEVTREAWALGCFRRTVVHTPERWHRGTTAAPPGRSGAWAQEGPGQQAVLTSPAPEANRGEDQASVGSEHLPQTVGAQEGRPGGDLGARLPHRTEEECRALCLSQNVVMNRAPLHLALRDATVIRTLGEVSGSRAAPTPLPDGGQGQGAGAGSARLRGHRKFRSSRHCGRSSASSVTPTGTEAIGRVLAL